MFAKLKHLQQVKGKGTTFVSLLIPEDKDMNSVMQMLIHEKATSKNIKSKQTRKLVHQSVDGIIRNIRELKLSKSPSRGIAIFSGQYV